MSKNLWLIAAMADDGVVADLLVRMKHSQASSSSLESSPPLAIPPRWGLRQSRSRMMVSAFRCAAASVSQRNKDSDFVRCSPTTPLSWSCGTSPSATADGFEESSLSLTASGSKDNAVNDSIKRLLRKRKFSELKEQEGVLLKERVYLNKDLATLRATFKEERARNENLRKMKLDLNSHSANNFRETFYDARSETIISRQSHQRENLATTTLLHPIHRALPPIHHGGVGDSRISDQCETRQGRSSTWDDSRFLLPDLNMTPSLDDSE